MRSVLDTELSQTVFNNKYRHDKCETWDDLSPTLVEQVVGRKGIPDDTK